MMSPLIVVGAGVAAASALRSLRRAGFGGAIHVFDADTERPYDRPPLSKDYLAGRLSDDSLALFGEHELDELGVELHLGRTVESLDAARRAVVLSGGEERGYEALLIANGLTARHLPYGHDLPGVHYLRTRRDARSLREALRGARRLVVIGAGFIGLEVAATARSLGLEVTVLEGSHAPLIRVLGNDAGGHITALHERRGVDLRFGCAVTGLLGEHKVAGVQFATADEGPCLVETDLVLIGIGAEPNTGWLGGSPVAIDDGIVCDSSGATSVEGVFAAGDVGRWMNELLGTHQRVEQWQTAVEHGQIVAARMAAYLGVADASPAGWASVPYFWSDQYEHKIQFCGSAGTFHATRKTRRGTVTCIGSTEGHLTGVLAIDDPASVAKGRRLVRDGVSWDGAQEWLHSL